jgi:hypothetical protein
MGRQFAKAKFILGAAIGLLAAVASAGAVAPGTWEPLAPAGPGEPGKSADPGLHRSPDGVLHVAWVHANGPLDATLFERRFSPAGVLQPGTSTIVDHWVDLGDAAFTDEPGGLRVFFGGQQTVSPGTPLGLQTATQAGQGWSPPTQLDGTYGVVSAVDGTAPVQVFQSLSRVVGRPGLTPNVPLTVYSSGLTDASPNVVRDAAGRVLVAWCGFGASGGGTYVQEVDPGTATPIGAQTVLPGSATPYGGGLYSTCVLQTEVSRRTPIVARAGDGVFVAGSAGYPTLSRVFVWRLGGSRLTAISEPAVTHSEPQLAAAPDGRIWVGWIRSGGGKDVLVVRRSNRAASAFGEPVRVPSPGGWTIGSFEASATAGQLDVVGQFSAGGSNSLRHTVVLPGLTLIRTRVVRRTDGRRTVTYRVLDAGVPVTGALVRVGSLARLTSANGRVTLTVRGSLRATATKRGYTRASISG